MFTSTFQAVEAFMDGLRTGRLHTMRCEINRQDKEMRERLNERQIDKMIQDSFPASDPFAKY